MASTTLVVEKELRIDSGNFKKASSGPLLAEFTDPCGIRFGEAIAEFFELAVTHFNIPRRFNGPPSLLKLGAIGLREVSFGIALHMNSAELDISVGKEALANGEQAGEVVLNKNHHPPKSTLNQTPKN